MMKYTDKTLMPFGKYKGIALANVPAGYLLWFYEQEWAEKWSGLYNYVQSNLKVLKKELEEDNNYDDYIHEDWGDRG